MSYQVYISDWFNTTLDFCAREYLEEDTPTERNAKYNARKNIITLSVKRCIVAKCPNMLNLVEIELITLGYAIVHKTKTKIKFAVACVMQVEKLLYEHFKHCRTTKWSGLVVCDTNTLSSHIIRALKKPNYRMIAMAYCSEKHGAKATLDLIDMVDRVWSLRV